MGKTVQTTASEAKEALANETQAETVTPDEVAAKEAVEQDNGDGEG